MKDFDINKYQSEFDKETKAILDVPRVAQCLEQHELIPYEYTTGARQMRYRRLHSELGKVLIKECPRLFMFCVKNHIDECALQLFGGGNLIHFITMRDNFSKRK